jgi:adenine phosphoribosyltransferase
MDLKDKIRNVPDFPIPGIQFKDITTLLKDGEAFRQSIDELYMRFANQKIDKIAAIESRGFILGSALAYKLGVGLIPIRKPGKLPAEKIAEEYTLEYGTDRMEMHVDAIQEGEHVLLVDDLLATGGTASASCRLVERLGGNVIGLGFLIELSFLNGREKLSQYNIQSLIIY